ncbi:MAG: glutaredoxin [Candidatus Gracilibacteria bacterium]|nr:glutaredoxin [Candidatus Gracilibacteria bacterium]
MKKLILFLILFFSQLLGVFASDEKIEFSVFTRDNCVHCIKLKDFLEQNSASLSGVQAKEYDIDIAENAKLFDEFTTKNSISKVTPIILIGDDLIEGYQGDDTTGKNILELAKKLEKSSYFENFEGEINKTINDGACDGSDTCIKPEKSKVEVKLPFLGIINLRDYSLLFLAIVLGFVDGFNPCAMWVLVMFISILSQTGSRKKMIQVAGVFIIAEAIMYYMILNVWYKTWDFIKLDNIVTPIIGLISLGAGAYFIYEFFTNKDGECKVISGKQKNKTIDKIKYIASKPMTIGVFFVTILIAFSVNIVEFACSIGIPQAFTKILEMSSLGLIEKQFYILLYTLFYMVDDFVVFGIAIYAMSYLSLTTKYTRYCLFIGGVIMLILGYFFLFNPAMLKLIIS